MDFPVRHHSSAVKTLSFFCPKVNLRTIDFQRWPYFNVGSGANTVAPQLTSAANPLSVI